MINPLIYLLQWHESVLIFILIYSSVQDLRTKKINPLPYIALIIYGIQIKILSIQKLNLIIYTTYIFIAIILHYNDVWKAGDTLILTALSLIHPHTLIYTITYFINLMIGLIITPILYKKLDPTDKEKPPLVPAFLIAQLIQYIIIIPNIPNIETTIEKIQILKGIIDSGSWSW